MRDPLYFPRTELSTALLSSLKSGISHAFTLFAPRRMGKTQFLTNDIAPAAPIKSGFFCAQNTRKYFNTNANNQLVMIKNRQDSKSDYF